MPSLLLAPTCRARGKLLAVGAGSASPRLRQITTSDRTAGHEVGLGSGRGPRLGPRGAHNWPEHGLQIRASYSVGTEDSQKEREGASHVDHIGIAVGPLERRQDLTAVQS